MQVQETVQTPPRERVVFLNALPLNAFGDMESFALNVARAELEELRKFSHHGNMVNYIRHPATVSLLRRYVANLPEPAQGLYRYSAGDVLVVVTLKSPQRGAEAQQVSEQDVVVHVVTVL